MHNIFMMQKCLENIAKQGTQPTKSCSCKREGETLSTPDAEKQQYVRRKTFDLDPDTLECPICSELFSPPVYQGENGHPTCSACCEKISKVCPSCSQPTGRIRNMSIEKILESLRAACKYASHGCEGKLKYSEIEEHENEVCEYQPTLCPTLGPYCKYKGPRMTILSHLKAEHQIEKVVYCSGPTTSSSFQMNASEPLVIFKAKEAWLLLHRWNNNTSELDVFECIIIGTPRKVVFKLTVEFHNVTDKVYSVQAVAHVKNGIDDSGINFLAVPRNRYEWPTRLYQVTLELVLTTLGTRHLQRHMYLRRIVRSCFESDAVVHRERSCIDPRGTLYPMFLP